MDNRHGVVVLDGVQDVVPVHLLLPFSRVGVVDFRLHNAEQVGRHRHKGVVDTGGGDAVAVFLHIVDQVGGVQLAVQVGGAHHRHRHDAAGAVIGGVVHLVGAGGVREGIVPPVRVGLRHIVKPQVGAVAQQAAVDARLNHLGLVDGVDVLLHLLGQGGQEVQQIDRLLAHAGLGFQLAEGVQRLHQRLQVGVVVIQHLRPRLGVGDKLQLTVAVGGKERGFDLRDGFGAFARQGAFGGVQRGERLLRDQDGVKLHAAEGEGRQRLGLRLLGFGGFRLGGGFSLRALRLGSGIFRGGGCRPAAPGKGGQNQQRKQDALPRFHKNSLLFVIHSCCRIRSMRKEKQYGTIFLFLYGLRITASRKEGGRMRLCF